MRFVARTLRRSVTFAAMLIAVLGITTPLAIYALDSRWLIAFPISFTSSVVGTYIVMAGLWGYNKRVEIYKNGHSSLGEVVFEHEMCERLSILGVPFILMSGIIGVFH